jgi:DNA-directed RNA polymerase subunit beta'
MRDVKVKSRRSKAVKVLNLLQGLERNGVTPDELMITRVPVIPPVFRPFAVQGQTFIPGDANELYRDLISMRDAYDDESSSLGTEAAAETFDKLRGAVRAVYGYGDPVEPKTLERGVSGFMKHIVGKGSSKHSFFQRKMVSKPMDNVGMSVITVDPDLSMDEVGVPEEMAWDMYKPYIQRRLVRKGHSAANAVRAIRDRTEDAYRELEAEVKERPVIYSRAPSWHKWNLTAGRARLLGDILSLSCSAQLLLKKHASLREDADIYQIPALVG